MDGFSGDCSFCYRDFPNWSFHCNGDNKDHQCLWPSRLVDSTMEHGKLLNYGENALKKLSLEERKVFGV